VTEYEFPVVVVVVGSCDSRCNSSPTNVRTVFPDSGITLGTGGGGGADCIFLRPSKSQIPTATTSSALL
jgi:hypothetical protein